jgi:hypothetical protein
VFEKIIKNRLVELLEKNNLLFENQFGFRPGKGTDQAIVKTTNIIYDVLEQWWPNFFLLRTIKKCILNFFYVNAKYYS